jgi:hypothetical protein
MILVMAGMILVAEPLMAMASDTDGGAAATLSTGMQRPKMTSRQSLRSDAHRTAELMQHLRRQAVVAWEKARARASEAFALLATRWDSNRHDAVVNAALIKARLHMKLATIEQFAARDSTHAHRQLQIVEHEIDTAARRTASTLQHHLGHLKAQVKSLISSPRGRAASSSALRRRYRAATAAIRRMLRGL